MAADPFTIYTDETIDNSLITGNGKFTVKTSNSFNNTSSYNSISVIVEFSDLVPDPENISTNYSLRAVVETSDDQGHWWPIGAQFEPLRRLSQGARQIIVIQPNIFNIDEGVFGFFNCCHNLRCVVFNGFH